MKEKRPYKKKNLKYWANKETSMNTTPDFMPTLNYEFSGDDHFTAVAALGGGGSTEYREAYNGTTTGPSRFKNISEGLLPWESKDGYVNIANAIVLCQKMYANVAVFRNAVESAVEFSNSRIHIKTSNETVRAYFTEWFNICINGFKEKWFREWYRSGNNFSYKFLGKIADSKFGKMKAAFGAKDPIIPIRYVILNPAQVYLTAGANYNNNYVKILSTYEVNRLKNPVTAEDKQVFNSLPDDIKKQIKSGGAFQNLYMPLDQKRLLFSFYKKQDYEPLAIPMGYPLLSDVEWKLEFKKMDMALSRTVEHVILLITTGTEPDKGGVNPQNVANLQSIFRNQTLGRVMVADYTTDGKWLIPDIGAILGPEKYQQVEKDIEQGIQAIFVGDDKFANASMKAKIFTERMKEGQKVFLNEFLIPEMKLVCEAMNFRDVPEVEFEQINLDDTSQKEKLMVRLAELGLLSPEETFTALESGIFPDKESNIVNQQEFKKHRDKGLYEPLLNSGKDEGEPGSPGGKKAPSAKKVGPIGTKANEESYSMARIAEYTIRANRLRDDVEKALMKKHKLTELAPVQKEIAESFAKAIMLNEPERDWLNVIPTYLKNPKQPAKAAYEQIDKVAAEFDISEWEAIIISKSRNIK